MKRIYALLLSLILFIGSFAICNLKAPEKESGIKQISGNVLSFGVLVQDMKKLNGEQVKISGYMSPAYSREDCLFYLMNKPLTKAPFTEDNTAVLTDTVAVFTLSPTVYSQSFMQVTGTLIFEEHTDANGNSYNYYIKDAAVLPCDISTLKGEAALWQELTSAGITDEAGAMFDYLSFLCNWTKNTFTAGGKNYYFTPEKALRYIELESGKYYYGFSDNYFTSFYQKVSSLPSGEQSLLLSLISKAQTLAEKAYLALKNGEYVYIDQYSNLADGSLKQYRLNDWQSIESEYNSLYESYNSWLEGWKI